MELETCRLAQDNPRNAQARLSGTHTLTHDTMED